MNRLQEKYKKMVVPAMRQHFGYKNDLAVPKIMKVIINTGIGKFRQEKSVVEEIERELPLIAGQKAVPTQAQKAIASFKTREGQIIGLQTTLRGERMYDFLDRLISLALPRSRDFRGLAATSVDERGNLTIGIKEHIIFPEISHEHVKNIFGLEVCVAVNAKTMEEGLELFK